MIFSASISDLRREHAQFSTFISVVRSVHGCSCDGLGNAASGSVSGDPSKDGEPFVIRLRGADGSKVPPHWHPTDENVTVLKGTFLVGMGETYDESKLQTMNTGNFTTVPKEMRHFANCKGETIIQVHGMGPFKVNWVNPADAPMPPAKP